MHNLFPKNEVSFKLEDSLIGNSEFSGYIPTDKVKIHFLTFFSTQLSAILIAINKLSRNNVAWYSLLKPIPPLLLLNEIRNLAQTYQKDFLHSFDWLIVFSS